MPNFPSFMAFSLLAIFTPGPNNIMALCNAGRYGFKKSLPFNVGVALGFLGLMSLCMAFSYFLYSVIPSVKLYVAAVGAAYMLYLAYKTLRGKPHEDGKTKECTTVLSGVGMQFINPKGILFSVTVAANYLAPYYKTVPPVAGLMLLLASLALISTSGWALFGSAFQKFISAHRAPFNVVMALLLAYCAVSLFI
jgi:cysteine/O-acetylserine efflux protein